MNKKHFLVFVVILFAAIVSCYWYLYYRWQHLWALEDPKPVYSVVRHHDDTLRVVMIGDSWVGMRTENLNDLFQSKLSEQVDRKVVLKTKGKGGENSRGIYQLMFEADRYGTQQLLIDGADYCVVLAGINDAATNKGVCHYVYHYKLILDFLFRNKIRPVVVEIPDVNIWTVYGKKPIKDLLGDYLRSTMTECDMYNYREYRDALIDMLLKDNLMNDVLLISMKDWNGENETIKKELFLDDQIHLNRLGYAVLDSCISMKIAQDYNSL